MKYRGSRLVDFSAPGAESGSIVFDLFTALAVDRGSTGLLTGYLAWTLQAASVPPDLIGGDGASASGPHDWRIALARALPTLPLVWWSIAGEGGIYTISPTPTDRTQYSQSISLRRLGAGGSSPLFRMTLDLDRMAWRRFPFASLPPTAAWVGSPTYPDDYEASAPPLTFRPEIATFMEGVLPQAIVAVTTPIPGFLIASTNPLAIPLSLLSTSLPRSPSLATFSGAGVLTFGFPLSSPSLEFTPAGAPVAQAFGVPPPEALRFGAGRMIDLTQQGLGPSAVQPPIASRAGSGSTPTSWTFYPVLASRVIGDGSASVWTPSAMNSVVRIQHADRPPASHVFVRRSELSTEAHPTLGVKLAMSMQVECG